jgi:hypothetical protein
MAVDPTYPLLPIFSIFSAVLMLIVLMNSFVRQSWNFGVSWLCFCLFWGNLTQGINAIIWSDNADLKLYVYCDIGIQPSFFFFFATLQLLTIIRSVSHLTLFVSLAQPACTLIITRRLHKIAALRSVEPSKIREVCHYGFYTGQTRSKVPIAANRTCHRLVFGARSTYFGDRSLMYVFRSSTVGALPWSSLNVNLRRLCRATRPVRYFGRLWMRQRDVRRLPLDSTRH